HADNPGLALKVRGGWCAQNQSMVPAPTPQPKRRAVRVVRWATGALTLLLACGGSGHPRTMGSVEATGTGGIAGASVAAGADGGLAGSTGGAGTTGARN